MSTSNARRARRLGLASYSKPRGLATTPGLVGNGQPPETVADRMEPATIRRITQAPPPPNHSRAALVAVAELPPAVAEVVPLRRRPGRPAGYRCSAETLEKMRQAMRARWAQRRGAS